jgi:hypothetical protein
MSSTTIAFIAGATLVSIAICSRSKRFANREASRIWSIHL